MRLLFAAGTLAVAMLLGVSVAQGQTWNLQLVDDAGDTGYDSQIVVASDGTPYVFYKSTSGYLNLAWWVGAGDVGGWQYKQLDSGVPVGYPFEVIADSQNRFHVAWGRTSAPNVKYGIYDPVTAAWVLGPETVTGAQTYDLIDLTLAQIGPDLIPVIAGLRDGDKVYVYKRDPGTGVWSNTLVDAVHNATHAASVAVDGLGFMHVSFYESSGLNLMYATKGWNDATWQISTVDVPGNVGDYSSIAVDSSNHVHIVYYDATNGDLKYATLTP